MSTGSGQSNTPEPKIILGVDLKEAGKIKARPESKAQTPANMSMRQLLELGFEMVEKPP